MASQVFYRKFRSQTLAELVGQSHVTQTLLNALKNNNISHAYLFCGPRGTGKTSTARILAKAINCLTTGGRGEPCNTCEMCKAIMEDRAMDVIEIDAASNRGIDDIRDLREKVNYAPSQARRKVYIIDEFHMLSREASNALLKTLEEPPPHVVFILATTEAHKVLPTILSRCQHFDFHRLSRTDVVTQLTKICQIENINIESQSLQMIARSTTGSLRDAENLLEQTATFYGTNISFLQVQAMLGITGDARVKEIVKHLINRDVSAGMATLNSVNNDGLDLRQFNRELIEYLRNLLLIKTGAVESVDLTVEDIGDLKDLADKATLTQVLQAVKLFGQIEMGNTENTTLPLELALIETYLAGEKPVPAAQAPTDKTPMPAPSAIRAATPRPLSQAGKPTTAVTEVKPAAQLPSQTHPEAPSSLPKQPVDIKAANAPSITPPAAKPSTIIEKPTAPDTETVASPVVAEKKEEFAKPATSARQPSQTVNELVQPAKESVAQAVNPVAASTPAASVSGGEIDRLRANWQRILEDSPFRKSTAMAILRSGCKLSSVGQSEVVLSFQTSVLSERMQKPENLKIAENIISDFLGRACQIRCICETSANHMTRSAIKLGAQVISVEEK